MTQNASVRIGEPPCPPPDPAPRPPSFTMPRFAADCHAHAIGPAQVYPFVEDRSYTPTDASIAAYLNVAKTLGLERTVLVQPSMHGIDNRPILGAIESPPDCGIEFRAVAVVAPETSERDYLDLHRRGVRGLRLNLIYRGGHSALDQAFFFAERIKDLGWHLQILCDVSEAKDVIGGLDRLSVPIVFDHFGHLSAAKGIHDPGFRTMLAMVRDGNAWVKISGAYRITRQRFPYEDVRPFAECLIDAASHRLVWGTDWPHTVTSPMPNDGDMVDLFHSWMPDRKTLEMILVENPQRLYQFTPRRDGG